MEYVSRELTQNYFSRDGLLTINEYPRLMFRAKITTITTAII